MQSGDHLDSLRNVLGRLSRELVERIRTRWAADWSLEPPKVGQHFSHWDLRDLASFGDAVEELGRLPEVGGKYSKDYLEQPIIAFLELVLASLPDPSMLDKALDYWWGPFAQFLGATELPVRLFIGLSNFTATRPLFQLDAENAVCFYDRESLAGVLARTVPAPSLDPFPPAGLPTHMIPGAIQVDFMVPANSDNLEHHAYSRACIDRMIKLESSLALSTFGRLVVGPWIPLLNPTFPIHGLRMIGSPEQGKRASEPTFLLDDDAFARFQATYALISRLHYEDEMDIEQDRAARRRFQAAIARFKRTYDQGYWESVVVDLVIVMESLLTPNKQGGRMQLALAGSNLLGTTPLEAREVFENLTSMYRLRNRSVHGEPMTEDTWEAGLLRIASIAGSQSRTIEGGTREFAFEVMRDYARRAIVATLHLFYDASRPPSEQLSGDLHRVHLDAALRQSILAQSAVYPLSQRPVPPPEPA